MADMNENGVPFKYQKIRGLIIFHYGANEEFAKVLGKSVQTVSAKLNCKVGFNQEDMIEWGKRLQIPVAEFGTYFFE